MKLSRSAFCIALLLAGSAHAQLYKWVGPDGKVTYSDSPPPSNASKVEKKNLGSSTVDTSNMPFELAEAVRNAPVTVYTGSDCKVCAEALALLNKRGIPFKEKTVSSDADVAKLKEITGGKPQVPFISIGRNKITGYESSTWDSALTSAGYPATNMLPANYSNPAAEAAAPPKKDKPGDNASANNEQRPTELPPATGNAPPGFRF